VSAGRQFLDRDTLAEFWRAALDASQRLARVERLPGGSKKGVYRLTAQDSSTVVLYVWDEAEDYWPGVGPDDPGDPFADANGLELFLAGNAALTAHDVRTPAVRLADATRTLLPAHFAVVEDVPGVSLETLLEDDPRGAEQTLRRLGDSLTRLHSVREIRIGKVAHAGGEARGDGRSCEALVLDRALRDLGEAGSRVDAIGAVHGSLTDRLGALTGAVRPRTEHGLIHGELGPDHVLVDDQGAPVLIDIEGLMFFDVEWEHAFLELRFGPHYEALRRPGLDTDRLALYRLALHLSLVAGPLRLLDGDFPDRDGMMEIVTWNVARVLSLSR
jgi:hypothetical protein